MIEDDTVTTFSTEESLDERPVPVTRKKKIKKTNKKDIKKIGKETFKTKQNMSKTIIKEIQQKPVKGKKVTKNQKSKQNQRQKKEKIEKKIDSKNPYIGNHVNKFTRTILEALYDLNQHYNE